MFLCRLLTGLVAFCSLMLPAIADDAPKVDRPASQLPDDARLKGLKNLNGYFPFAPPESKAAWEERASDLRRQLLVATGLWPIPEATPLNPVIHGKVDRPGYTVERVYFESYPGHFVTGSLYRPQGEVTKRPAVLCPHGHWANGRFHDHGEKEIAKELASGAEKYERGGRHVLQARCVQLARMGCVVFLYDMVGYADSIQIEHRPGVRKSMNTAENWGFFSPQAELRLQSMMGLQTYNSLRALDFLTNLPDVDPERVGVTGASGGGTQTFMLCAIDPRPKVAFPAVMVSTAMQGGCTCENCNYLRIGTGNVEIAGLFAPKPLGMTAANDWTREIETKGYPDLQRLYRLFGVEDNLLAAPFLQFGHNYNYVSRAVMYGWMNKHLGLGQSEPIVEADYEPLTIAEATVWDESHPRPPHGDDYERSLVKYMTSDSDKQIAAATPHDAASLAKFREVVGGAWNVLLGGESPAAEEVKWENITETRDDAKTRFAGILRDSRRGSATPVVFLLPHQWNRRLVIVVHPAGKSGIEGNGSARADAERLLANGTAVAGIDLFRQGEFLPDGTLLSKQPMVDDALVGYTGYTYGYNYPLFSERVQDLISLITFAEHYEDQPEQINLLGYAGNGPIAAAAVAMSGDVVKGAVIDTAGFRFAQLTEFDHPDFVPGTVKYGDLPALLALCAGKKLFVAGEGAEMPALFKAATESSGASDRVIMHTEQGAGAPTAIDWLVNQ